MGCRRCGSPTSRRLCKNCSTAVRAENEARHGPDPDWYECPECGGSTSGEGVVCYRCRGDDEGPELRADGGVETARVSSKSAGDRSEGAVIEAVDELEHVPDLEAEHYDAVTTTVLVPSETVSFAGICVLERGTVVEIKSVMVVYGDGQRGRFYLRQEQHRELLSRGGSYLFAVCAPRPDREVLALKVVPASLVDELIPSWLDGGEGRADYAQIAWSRVFDPDEVGREVVTE